jgi:hypothetical protein
MKEIDDALGVRDDVRAVMIAFLDERESVCARAEALPDRALRLFTAK